MKSLVCEPACKEPLVAVRDNDDIRWLDTALPEDRRRSAGISCFHNCRHLTYREVAEGHDDAHYRLVVCTDVCDGSCRGWLAKEKYGGTEYSSRRVSYVALLP
jgi:hypothetical protein